MKKNRYSKCYIFFTILASKKCDKINPGGFHLMLMVVKEQMKKEFGIKSLKDLSNKELKRFETFLAEKL